MEEHTWPKYICGDKNHIRTLVELLSTSWKAESKAWAEKSSPESQFLAWLSEWYPELYGEFNKVLSGKQSWDDVPKYTLTEEG